jgi:hypothetical protein
MTEQLRPQPEKPKQSATEAEGDVRGLPSPSLDLQPQVGGSTEFDLRRPEEEATPAQKGSESSRVQHRGRPRTLDDPLAWEQGSSTFNRGGH